MPEEFEPGPDSIRGSLWGLVIGDALGAPVEGVKEGHIRQLVGAVHGYVDLCQVVPEKPWRWRRPGLHTDDGQQALLVVEAMLGSGGADGAEEAAILTTDHTDHTNERGGTAGVRPHPVATRFARLLLALATPPGGIRFDEPTGAHRGTGSNFRTFLARLSEAGIRNDDPAVWTCNQPSAGTGAAMRIGPVGAWSGAATEDEVIRLAIEISLLTHGDPRGIAAAVAVALGVRRLAGLPSGGRRIDAREFVVELAASVRGAEERIVDEYARWLSPVRMRERDFDLSDSLGVVGSLAREGDDVLARRTLVAQAQSYVPLQAVTQPNHGFAPVAIPMAFYRALTASSFVIGLEAVVNDGGDADTMGAIAGALLGARYGVESIPLEWRQGLVARGIVGQRADALVEGYHGRDWDDLIGHEAEWSRDEAAARRSLVEALERKNERQGRRQEAKGEKGKAGDRGGKGKPSAPQTPRQPTIEERIRDLPFAPPPEIWLRGKSPARPPVYTHEDMPETLSPVEKKREKAARGRKRIGWKEERRNRRKDGSGGEED